MSEMKFTQDHEWLRLEDDDTAVVGITDYAQEQLGDLVHIELPEVDTEMAQGDEAAIIESVKAASEVKMPVSGIIIAINEALIDDPAKVNEDSTGAGWFFKIKIMDPSELDELLDEDSYHRLLEDLQ